MSAEVAVETGGSPAFVVTVLGIPAPQGSKNGYARGGRVVLVESSKKVKPWREKVHNTAKDALPAGWEPLTGPLVVDMVFSMPRPQRVPLARLGWPAATPDLSKLARSTEDALTTAGVWADDALVVSYARLEKRYADPALAGLHTSHPLLAAATVTLPEPGVRIAVWPAGRA